jgi:hypothetical protein
MCVSVYLHVCVEWAACRDSLKNKNLCQEKWSVGQDLNPGLPVWEALLLTWPWCSVKSLSCSLFCLHKLCVTFAHFVGFLAVSSKVSG